MTIIQKKLFVHLKKIFYEGCAFIFVKSGGKWFPLLAESFLIAGQGVLHQIFGTWVQHTEKKLDLRFCENEGSKDLKSMKKGVNWIEN